MRDMDLKVLAFISDFVEDRHFPPTFREIAAALDLPSTATVQRALNRLAAAGLVSWDPGRGRTITIRKVAP